MDRSIQSRLVAVLALIAFIAGSISHADTWGKPTDAKSNPTSTKTTTTQSPTVTTQKKKTPSKKIPKKKTPAQASPKVDSQNPKEEILSVFLPKQIVYANELANFRAPGTTEYLGELFMSLDVRGAARATAVTEEKYNHIAFNKNLYVTTALRDLVLNSKACDVNSVGACVVVEKRTTKDNASSAEIYMLGSAPSQLISNYEQVARKDITEKTIRGITSRMLNILENSANGVYVFSAALSKKEAQAAHAQLIDTTDVPTSTVIESNELKSNVLTANEAAIAQNQNVIIDIGPQRVELVTRAEEIQKFDARMQAGQTQTVEIVKSAPAIAADSSAETLATREALFNYCQVTADLKMVRRFFIIDVLREKTDLNGNNPHYKPTKIGKGLLECNLKNGVRQRVKILLKDYQYLRIGFAFSKVNEHFFATGAGWANGALDILLMKKFGYFLKTDVQALVGGISYTKLFITSKTDVKPVFGFAVSGVWSPFFWGNINFTPAGEYEISIDPEET